jgi:hypothetical protein
MTPVAATCIPRTGRAGLTGKLPLRATPSGQRGSTAFARFGDTPIGVYNVELGA